MPGRVSIVKPFVVWPLSGELTWVPPPLRRNRLVVSTIRFVVWSPRAPIGPCRVVPVHFCDLCGPFGHLFGRFCNLCRYFWLSGVRIFSNKGRDFWRCSLELA